MNVTAALTQALNHLKQVNNATLTYVSGSTTVSASVFKSYIQTNGAEVKDAGLDFSMDDTFVLATPSDVSSWGLTPMKSKVSLDGVQFMVGNNIIKSAAHWQIWLRIKK